MTIPQKWWYHPPDRLPLTLRPSVFFLFYPFYFFSFTFSKKRGEGVSMGGKNKIKRRKGAELWQLELVCDTTTTCAHTRAPTAHARGSPKDFKQHTKTNCCVMN